MTPYRIGNSAEETRVLANERVDKINEAGSTLLD